MLRVAEHYAATVALCVGRLAEADAVPVHHVAQDAGPLRRVDGLTGDRAERDALRMRPRRDIQEHDGRDHGHPDRRRLREARPRAIDRDVIEQAGRKQRLQRRIKCRGVEPPIGRCMKV